MCGHRCPRYDRGLPPPLERPASTPRDGYGQNGEGFFRIALTVDEERMREAVERIRKNFPDLEF